MSTVANFLAGLFEQGYSYRSLNSYRSSISSTHDRVDGAPVGQHPIITRLLAGAFNSRPPQPRYTTTWDVNSVTSYLKSLSDNSGLSLKELTLKTTMLLALARPSRSADLWVLSTHNYYQTPEGVSFSPKKMTQELFFNRFEADPSICPVTTVLHYIERMEPMRNPPGKVRVSRLFLSWIKPHNPVTSASIARWLKTVLHNAEIDTSIFKAHSIRGASASAAKNLGVTTKEILQTAD